MATASFRSGVCMVEEECPLGGPGDLVVVDLEAETLPVAVIRGAGIGEFLRHRTRLRHLEVGQGGRDRGPERPTLRLIRCVQGSTEGER